MALQLPLALDEPPASRRRLWILSVEPERLPLLRQAVAGRVATVIGVDKGRDEILADDAILIRTSPDRYEAYGRAAALFTQATDLEADLSPHLIRAVAAVHSKAVDMIAFGRGASVRLQSDYDPVTSVERLVAAVRDRDRRLGREARLELCQFALSQLTSEQQLLRAVLSAQAQRLAALISVDPSGFMTDADFAHQGALFGTPLEHLVRALAPASDTEQLDFFASRPSKPPRDFSLTAFPVVGLAVELRSDQQFLRSAAFTDRRPNILLNEAALSPFFEELHSRRLTAVAELAGDSTQPTQIDVCVDWDVRQTLRPLVPRRAGAGRLHVWLESLDGSRLTVAKSGAIGQQMQFDVCSTALGAEDTVEGVIAFRSSFGGGGRKKFRLRLAS